MSYNRYSLVTFEIEHNVSFCLADMVVLSVCLRCSNVHLKCLVSSVCVCVCVSPQSLLSNDDLAHSMVFVWC